MFYKLLSIRISRLIGFFANLYIPHFLRNPLIRMFARSFKVNLHECNPKLDAYASFNAFFTRPLQPECRNIDTTKDALISPVDGTVSNWGSLKNNQLLQAKETWYNIHQLIPNHFATQFQNGDFTTLYLAPHDCHRIFAPYNCSITAATHVPGYLFPVRPPHTFRQNGLFSKNERLILHLNTSHGPIALVAVGAFNVGTISLPFDPSMIQNRGKSIHTKVYAPSPRLNKGDWIATFHLGSTVILITPPLKWAFELENQKIQYGQPIGHFTSFSSMKKPDV